MPHPSVVDSMGFSTHLLSPALRCLLMRSPLLLLLLIAAIPAGICRAVDFADAATIKAFTETYCLSCHDSETKKAGLDVQTLSTDLADKNIFARWQEIHDRIIAGEMPPADMERPSADEAQAFTRSVAQGLTEQESVERKENGRTVIRRLNRAEYENTLRDLLDLPGLNVKDMLPDDGRAYGYDRSAAALEFSSVLLNRYSQAFDAAFDEAIAKYAVPPEVYRSRMYGTEQYDLMNVAGNGDAVILKDFKYDPRFPIPDVNKWGGRFIGLGEAIRGGAFKEPGTMGLMRHKDEAFQCRFRFAPIHPGRYRIAMSVWSFWWDKGEIKPSPRMGAAGLYVGPRLLGHFDAPSLNPTHHEFEVWLEPTGYMTFNPASLWPFRVDEYKGRAAAYVGPGVAVDWINIEGPLHDEWPPPSHKKLFGDLPLVPYHKLAADAPKPKRTTPQQIPGDAANGPGRLVFGTVQSRSPVDDARQLLAEFLPRAFRRSVPSDELEGYVAAVEGRVKNGSAFEDAMRAVYQVVLCSPDFLFLNENPGPLDDYAVANRLSYFLWNSMPDDVLFDLAREKKLRDPGVLRQQIDRMLGDPKSERFVADFLNQWLDLRELDLTSPDKTLYPEFTPILRDAIEREPQAFFREMINRNAPATAIVDSDFMTINQRLAEHYGAPKAAEGTRIRGIGIPGGSSRGGLLTTAAALKVTANGTTTSPVKRGAWVMRKILGQPPKPPPPDIPVIEPDVRGATTIRELLSKHRDNAACSSCHSKMDPPGFALECFDVIGGKRSLYRVTQGEVDELARLYPGHTTPEGKFGNIYPVSHRKGPAVDTSGEIAAGVPFQGIDDFKKLLLQNRRQIETNFVQQLAIYATGAPIGFSDRKTIDQIVERSGGNVKNLIYELVASELFLNK